MSDTKFDASKYLTKLGQKDYLEVKWRLLWLRTEHPDASIVTEMVERQGNFAIFKATVSIPNGGDATGWGSEDVEDFGDFIEKAETKAIGRALAALGFGTQFCEDFNEDGTVTDSPVQRQQTRPAKPQRTAPDPRTNGETPPSNNKPAPRKQPAKAEQALKGRQEVLAGLVTDRTDSDGWDAAAELLNGTLAGAMTQIDGKWGLRWDAISDRESLDALISVLSPPTGVEDLRQQARKAYEDYVADHTAEAAFELVGQIAPDVGAIVNGNLQLAKLSESQCKALIDAAYTPATK